VARRRWKTKAGTKTGWYVVIDIGRDPDGKRRQKWHGSFATRAEAETHRVALVVELEAGTDVEPSALTVDERVGGGWWVLIMNRVKPSTADAHESNFVISSAVAWPHPVDKSAGRASESALHRLLREGRTDGRRGLGPHTVRNVHVIIRLTLRDACAAGLVARNVAELASPPPRRSPRRTPLRFWQPHELRLFLAAVEGEPLEPAWHLVALTGMRRGEAAALLWDDVDFDNQRVYIRQTRSRIGTEMVVTSPKSGTGCLIDIDRDTTRRIVEHRERQTAAAARLGLANPDRFVFLKPHFVRVGPDYLSERYLRISAHVGLPRIRFHDLRHTYATISLASGVPINVVSQRLGHANTSVTLNVYSHVMPGMQAAAAQGVADFISGTDNSEGAADTASKLTRNTRHGPWRRHLEQHQRPA